MSWCPELKSLHLLLTVAATGSITEAAHLEQISQPAASKRLHALERSLGMRLIDRTPAGSQLTREGKIAADWAAKVFETIEQMFDALGSMQPHTASNLRVAASMTVAEHMFPLWLANLRAKRPEMHVGLRVANSQEVQRLVVGGEADLGIVETRVLDRRLRSAVIDHDRLVVVVSPSHPWALRSDPLPVEELAMAELIVREEGSGTRDTLDRWTGTHSKAVPMLELGSNAAVRGAVKAGTGPAVLSVLTVREDLRAGTLVEVPVHELDLRRPISAVWRKGTPIMASSTALLEAVAQVSGGAADRD